VTRDQPPIIVRESNAVSRWLAVLLLIVAAALVFTVIQQRRAMAPPPVSVEPRVVTPAPDLGGDEKAGTRGLAGHLHGPESVAVPRPSS